MSRKNHNNTRYEIPSAVKDFFKCKKKDVSRDFAYSSKKEITEVYYKRLIVTDLPQVIDMLVFHGMQDDVKALKPYIYARITSDRSAHEDKKKIIKYDNKKFIKYFNEFLDDDDEEIENIDLFPIVIADICREFAAQEAADKQEGDNVYYDVSDLMDLSTKILKKKMKKMGKEGIDKDLAFDCLSVIPCSRVLKRGALYRLRQLMQVMYSHANTDEKVDFPTVMKYVVTSDYYPALIAYLLLEKKQDYVDYTDKQKDFFNTVTDWCINTMESMEKEEIREILKVYFDNRKKDKANNKDANRRYFLSSIPENEFPKITRVIAKMKDVDSSIEEFL